MRSPRILVRARQPARRGAGHPRRSFPLWASFALAVLILGGIALALAGYESSTSAAGAVSAAPETKGKTPDAYKPAPPAAGSDDPKAVSALPAAPPEPKATPAPMPAPPEAKAPKPPPPRPEPKAAPEQQLAPPELKAAPEPLSARQPLPPVEPGAKLDALALARLIDREIQEQLDARKLPASGRADDAEFLRRVYLDIHGVIPPADKVVAFLDSKDPNKRAKLIDELLASPHYGRHLADIWANRLLGTAPT